MNECDEEWDNFCDGIETDRPTIDMGLSLHDNNKSIPKSTNIYISTKTKIAYLNKNIDLKECFWKINVMPYSTAREGVIKKQMKFIFVDEAELSEVQERLSKEEMSDEQIISHIRNVDGKIPFKDIRKISVGVCKKDITSYRCKQKSAFYNCFVIIIRLLVNGIFKESHVKIFNTGKLELPGIQTEEGLDSCLRTIVAILNTECGLDIALTERPCETVLINSNFSCGYYIDRDKLSDILKFKYHIHTSYDPCSYPGIMSKFYYYDDKQIQDGIKDTDSTNVSEMSFMIFRTGSVLIVGKCTENVLMIIYEFLKTLLTTEYNAICQPNMILEDKSRVVKQKKVRKRLVNVQI